MSTTLLRRPAVRATRPGWSARRAQPRRSSAPTATTATAAATAATLADALCSATPAQRITAARAWGAGLARFHQLHGAHGDVTPQAAVALRLAPYQWRVELVPAVGLKPADEASDLAAACAHLRSQPGSLATVRAGVRALCEGYHGAGGTAALPRS
jgi:hypothetical protein